MRLIKYRCIGKGSMEKKQQISLFMIVQSKKQTSKKFKEKMEIFNSIGSLEFNYF